MATFTLDDAIARHRALGADDEQGTRELRAILGALAASPSLPDPVREIIARAAVEIDFSTPATLREVLVDVGKLLTAAETRLSLRDSVAAALGTPTPPTPSSFAAPPAPVMPAGDRILPDEYDASLLADFVAEGRELAEGAEAALLSLEDHPDDAEALNTAFRAFHTVKGTSAFLGLIVISEFAHQAEALLSRMRDHELRCEGAHAALALRAADMLGVLMARIRDELDGRAPESLDDVVELTMELEGHQMVAAAPAAPLPAMSAGAGPSSAPSAPREPVAVTPQPSRDEHGAAGHTPTAGDATMRVRTTYVDRLMELVGELAIVQSIVAQDEAVNRASHGALGGKLRHAEKIARELQNLSMSMRMVPLKGVFQKLNRLTRDVAGRTGKAVLFRTAGGDTEIDRYMVDVLSDPLVHMVRNAVDHGLETREERRAAGKPEEGVVSINAWHVGGNVVIELADDGRGLDRTRIARKAVERGLITSAEGLPDEDVFRLIFEPGFSTADKITDVSGRGVGMDVVRHNIEALRGRVEISSELGKGTRFTLRLPLTLAISDGMLVRVGDERFIVPTLAIQLSFRPTRAALATIVGNGEGVLLRDELLPLVRLHRIFAVKDAVEDPSQAVVMVVGDGAHRAALLVDELLGQQQVVVKSLGSGIAHAPGISGGAILGDGRVGLILDVTGLLNVARRGAVTPLASRADTVTVGRAVA